jgi:hypothetical protein
MTTRVDCGHKFLIGVPGALGTPVLANRMRKFGDHGCDSREGRGLREDLDAFRPGCTLESENQPVTTFVLRLVVSRIFLLRHDL